MLKVIIAGSRDFQDYTLLREKCDHFLQNHSDVEIVSGTAKGADLLGEKYANEKGYKITRFPADWDLGRKAGPIRNRHMAEYADVLIVFWNGESKGTLNMISVAKELNLKVRIVHIK